jgi:hypothetical protein
MNNTTALSLSGPRYGGGGDDYHPHRRARASLHAAWLCLATGIRLPTLLFGNACTSAASCTADTRVGRKGWIIPGRKTTVRVVPSCAASSFPLARALNDGCLHSLRGKPNLFLTYMIAGHVRITKVCKARQTSNETYLLSPEARMKTWNSATGENVHVEVRSSMGNTPVTRK